MLELDDYKKHGTMEITTRIGCKVRCKYCPQDKLIQNYKEKSNIYQMSINTFKRCLDKIPRNIQIDFSGMAEPWLNPRCTEMLLYAHKQGFNIAVYTTLVGMTLNDIELIKDIPFTIFMIHLSDIDQNATIPVDSTYLQMLKKIKASDISHIAYTVMGQTHDDIKEIVQQQIIKASIHSRAGNVKHSDITQIHKKQGKLICRSSKKFLNHNVLLPNGDVLICCMDYSMQHILGSLIESSYNSLFQSKEFNVLQQGLNDSSSNILCRYCIMSE